MSRIPRERWREIDALFDQALDVEPSLRGDWLRSRCGGDEELRVHVQEMIDLAERTEGFLERPAEEVAADLLRELGRTTDGPVDAALPEPTHIGSYRILRELGRGGMGVVYLAERDDGQFARQVAVKVIKRGLDTDEVIGRFLQERQILAGLRHPHIARLFDGGITDDGRPYLVMEFVDGRPITEHCRGLELGTAARLDLFEEVCDAVQYAHENLVVHRDLKPSNILVDPRGHVSLVDFGVAKLLDPTLPGATPTRTLVGARPMTPEYASPEVVRGETPTTAADVYALGVVLHELLTGERPKAGEVVGSGDAAPALAMDLRTIVTAAIHPERERRYTTVESLLADVRRYRRGYPITARPDEWSYRLRRFAARNRAAVAAGVVVVLAATGFGIFHGVRIARERDRAVAQAARAEQVTAFLIDLFRQADPDAQGGDSLRVRDFLDIGATRVRDRLAEQPEVRADLMAVIGGVYQTLGLLPESRAMLEESVSLQRASGSEDPVTLAGAFRTLGILRYEQGEYEAADSALTEALALVRGSSPDEAIARATILEGMTSLRYSQGRFDEADSLGALSLSLLETHLPPDDPRLATTLTAMGMVARRLDRLEESEGHYRRSLALLEAELGERHSRVAQAHKDVALALHSQARLDEAEREYRAALALYDDLFGPNHPRSSTVLNALGALLTETGDLEGAEQMNRRSLDLRVQMFGARHPRAAVAMNNLALVLRDLGRFEEAERLFRESIEIRVAAEGEDHPGVATAMVGLGRVLAERGDFPEADRVLADATVRYVSALGPDHTWVAIAQHARASARLRAGDPEGARVGFLESLATLERGGDEQSSHAARATIGLGRALLASGRVAEAQPLLREGLDLSVQHFGQDHLESVRARVALAECALERGDAVEARELLARADRSLVGMTGIHAERERERSRALRAMPGMGVD